MGRTAENKKNILDEAKPLIPLFYYDGEWKDSVVLEINGKKIDDIISNSIKELFILLLETKLTSNVTKIYLKSYSSSVRSAIEDYNRSAVELDRINNINTAQNNIQYDKKKLNKYFSEEYSIYNLLSNPEIYLDGFINIVRRLQREYMDDSEYKNAMVLKLSKEYISSSLDDTEWIRLLKLLQIYSTRAIEAINEIKTKSIDTDMVGYYNYLISSKNLSAVDRDRLKQLRTTLGLE